MPKKYRNAEISKFHTPVLLKEVAELLNLKPGDNVIDATFGGGGHAAAMLKAIGPGGKLLGIDQDPEIIKRTGAHKMQNLKIIHGNFRDLDKAVQKAGLFKKADAVLFDLGLSGWHLKESGRGFSFGKIKEPLMMSMGQSEKSAAEILNSYSGEELANLLFAFGEVPHARALAKKIVEARARKRIISVGDLLAAIGVRSKKSLARIFQALRIAVNDELGALSEGLPKAFKLLAPGGRLAVISYHSLEDRIVKQFFLNQGGEIMTKKPVRASSEEIMRNISARSAKLRVIKKLK